QSDLDVFKAAGATPLREAILGALGVTVRYVRAPRPASPPQGTPPAAQKTTAPQAPVPEPEQSEQSERSVKQRQAPEASAEQATTTQRAVQTSTERASALGPVGAAPAWADYQPEAPVPAEDDPYEHSSADPYQPSEPAPPREAPVTP